MALHKLYRKQGVKGYNVESRPSCIEIRILPLLICLLISIMVWCFSTGNSRPESEATETSTEAVSDTLSDRLVVPPPFDL